MKVILSWSGNDSRQIAAALQSTLSTIFEGLDVRFWVSAVDIALGKKWQTELSNALESSNVIVLCFTPASLNSSWMIFEAGAVSSKIGDDIRIIPFVTGSSFEGLPEPLQQFQGCTADEKGFESLTQTLNNIIKEEKKKPHTDNALTSLIEKHWKILSRKLSSIKPETPEIKTGPGLNSGTLSQDSLFKYLSKRFGVGHRKVLFTCKITVDGTVNIRREVHVEAYQPLRSLDTYLFLADSDNSPDGYNLLAPEISTDDLYTDVKLIQTKVQKVTATEILIGTNDDSASQFQKVVAEIKFDPPLLDQGSIIYQMVEQSQNQVFLVDDEDSFGWAVHRPTRYLQLKVIMPQKSEPKVFNRNVKRATTLGFSSQQEIAELPQVPLPVKKSLSDGLIEYSLKIPSPMIGLIYRLQWSY